MRGWQTVCVVVAVVTVAMVGNTRTLAAQILQYTEPRHSRSEIGIPGSNVTGGWSWVDHHGQQHHIWYVADTRGFRAFGDVIPEATFPTNVGVPVVVAIPLASIQQKATQTPTNPHPEVSVKTERTVTPESSQGGDQGKGMKRESTAINIEPEESTLPPVTSPTTDAMLQEEVTEEPQGKVTGDEEKGDMIITTTTPANIPSSTPEVASDISIPSSTPSTITEPSEEPLVVQPMLEDKTHGSPKSLAAPLSDASFHSPKQSPVTPSDNNFVASVFNKLSTALGAHDDNMQKPLFHQEPENVDTHKAEQHSETDFVLINRLRAPTVPKPRVGTQQLMPKLVNVKGQTNTVVMGLHSSGQPSTKRQLTFDTGSLEPLGIHFLNRVPHQQKTVSASRPVPRPVRIFGEPNLDNFFQPADLVTATPKHFRTPHPTRDYDYQYDYYDYNDYRGDNTGGPVNPVHKTKTKSVRSNSEEYSLETDYSDSEESEDSSSDHQ